MLSVVIPALNAAATLADCLGGVAEADEIVVVDGGSTDDTARIAEARGARLVRSERGRGVQLTAGAEATRSDWLLFLHADTRLGPAWRAEADAHLAAHPAEAACFRFQLADPAWQARLVERGVRLRRFPYGDQGLLVSREVYARVGGYRPIPLMEDVDLVRRIGRVRVLSEFAWTSATRWRRDGWARRSARNLGIRLLYGLGASPERLARLYG